jgi:tRNA threonylcarbamoyladenosine biosynthesis protein TsaE
VREPSAASLTSEAAEQTHALGVVLGRAVDQARGAPLVIGIEGELGAGKTTLVGGLLHALGVKGPVRSPTYTLIEPYTAAARSIYHIDLYRIADPREVDALGLRDVLTQDAVLLIEWPSRGTGVLPVPDLAISIDYELPHATHRRLLFTANSPPGRQLLGELAPVLPE